MSGREWRDFWPRMWKSGRKWWEYWAKKRWECCIDLQFSPKVRFLTRWFDFFFDPDPHENPPKSPVFWPGITKKCSLVNRGLLSPSKSVKSPVFRPEFTFEGVRPPNGPQSSRKSVKSPVLSEKNTHSSGLKSAEKVRFFWWKTFGFTVLRVTDLQWPRILAERPFFQPELAQIINLMMFMPVNFVVLKVMTLFSQCSTDVSMWWSTVPQMSWNVVCPIDSTFFPSQAKGPDWIENCRLMMMANERWWWQLRTKGFAISAGIFSNWCEWCCDDDLFLPFDWNLMGCFGVDVAFPVAALQRVGEW